MAITQGTVKFKIVMNRGAAGTPVFTFTDQTDYVGNSEAIADVKGAIKIEYGSTVYYDNLSNIETTPDIDGSDLGQVNEALTRANTITTPIDLPTNASGNIVSGQYKFTYSVKVGAGSTITNVVVVDATYSAVSGNLTSLVDLTPTAPSITVTDTTNYVVQNVTPTGTPQITLYYPADAAASPTVVNASQLVANSFYTGEQVAKLSSTKVWDYSNKLISSTFTSGYFTLLISDVVTDRISINVEANNTVCALFCCLKDFSDKLLAAKSNPTTYKHYVDIAGQVAFFYNSIIAAYECSKTENVNIWIDEIRSLVNCTSDCGCDGTQPVLITAITEVVVPNAVWGDITGTLSNQTDLQAALDAKQATLVSGTNIKTINSTSLLGSGNIDIVASKPVVSYASGAEELVVGQVDTCIYSTNSSFVLAILGSNDTAIPVGSEILLVANGGAGITITSDGTTTLNGSLNATVTVTQYKPTLIKKVANTTYVAG